MKKVDMKNVIINTTIEKFKELATQEKIFGFHNSLTDLTRTEWATLYTLIQELDLEEEYSIELFSQNIL